MEPGRRVPARRDRRSSYKQRVVVVGALLCRLHRGRDRGSPRLPPRNCEVTGIAGAQPPAQGGRTMRQLARDLEDFEDRIRSALSIDAGRAPLSGTAPALWARRQRRCWTARPWRRFWRHGLSAELLTSWADLLSESGSSTSSAPAESCSSIVSTASSASGGFSRGSRSVRALPSCGRRSSTWPASFPDRMSK